MVAWVWYVTKLVLFAALMLAVVSLVIWVINDYRDLRDHFDND